MNLKIILIILAIIVSITLLIYFFVLTPYRTNKAEIIPRPELSFGLRFKEVPPIDEDIFARNIYVHYRGINVGKVREIKLAEDQKSVLFNINIYYKDLRLPINTSPQLRLSNVTGRRYIELDYPQDPSSRLIKNGDIIDAEAVFLIRSIEKLLMSEISSGKIERILNNTEDLTSELNGLVKGNKEQINTLLGQITKTSKDLNIIFDDLKEVIGDKSIKEDLKSTVVYTQKLLKSAGELLEDEDIKTAPQKINTIIENLNQVSADMNQIIRKLDETDSLLGTTNCNLSHINAAVDTIPLEDLEGAGKTLKKIDCLSEGLIEMLNQRAILLRLMFGDSSRYFGECKTVECLN